MPQTQARDPAPVAERSAAAMLTLQFLDWLQMTPRTYDEVMAGWRTSCPRLSIWEDALIDRLVRRDGDHVVLTPRGRAMLDSGA